MTHPSDSIARLLIRCDDRPGIVAAVSGFMHAHGANITALDQHSTDPEGGTFFMRLEFQTPHLDITGSALKAAFAEVVGQRFDMDWSLTYAAVPKRVVLFVSKWDHALLELLWRFGRGELTGVPLMVISNHPDLGDAVRGFGVDFHHVPVTRDTREAAEARVLELIDDQADLLVLARYMQILSPEFVAHFAHKIINIHHSFLPAFAGADPYRQACDRGVKLIGATAHFVTAELDAGPIIEQDVARVAHHHDVQDLKRMGHDVERRVLTRAVRWFLEDRIIVHGNRTIVFSGRSS